MGPKQSAAARIDKRRDVAARRPRVAAPAGVAAQPSPAVGGTVDATTGTAFAAAPLPAPRAERAIARPRLCDAIESSAAPIVWVAAPAGAGKTLGVARSVAARAANGTVLWYEVDDEDRDPGTLVAELGLALSERDRSRTPPQLAPVPAFAQRQEARRLFELLLGPRRGPLTVVLDNLQAADDAPGFVAIAGGLFEAFARGAPLGSKLIVTSRRAPPRELSRMVVEGAIEVLEPDLLRLDQAEMETLLLALAPKARTARGRSAAELLGWSDGWVVAAVMLARQAVSGNARLAPATPEAFGQYLSSELFERLPREVRHALELLAFFPRATAQQLAQLRPELGFEDLAARVAELGMPHTVEEDGSLKLHDLVRERLRDEFAARPAQLEPDGDLPKLIRALAAEGQIKEATELGARFGCQDELAALVLHYADSLLSVGRTASVEGLLAHLPADAIELDPQLLFWSSACLMTRDPNRAYEGFRRAFAAFEAQGNIIFASLCAASLVQAIMLVGQDLRLANTWVEYLERPPRLALPLPVQARARTAVLMTHSWACRGTAQAQRAADEAMSLIGSGIPVSDAVSIAGAIILVYQFSGRSADAAAALRVARCLAADAAYDLLAQVSLSHFEVLHRLMGGGTLEGALQLAEQVLGALPYPIPHWSGAVACVGLMAACAFGETGRAAQFLPVLEQSAVAGSSLARGQYLFARALFGFAGGEIPTALEDMQASVALSEACGLSWGPISGTLAQAIMLVSLGRFAEARAVLAHAQARIALAKSRYFEVDRLLIQGLLLVEESGPEAARAVLAQALSEARAINHCPAALVSRSVVQRIVSVALELEIEPEYAKQIARWANLTPPADDFSAAWPWSVVLRTLGSFQLESSLDGADSASNAGPQRKLLELLVAARGEPVLVTRLASELWPSRTPAASRSAFDTTLHRLRRQLGDDTLVLLEAGTVRLDRSRIWVDAWAFAALHEAVERAAQTVSLAELERLSRHALALYRGPFAEAEPQPSLVRASARLTRSFVQTIERLVNALRKHAALEQAVNLAEAALDREETNESLHQLTITLWLERGLPAEAERAYQRCRTVLHTRCKTTPPLAIDRLIRSARVSRGDDRSL